MSSIEEVADIIREREFNQALTEITKLLSDSDYTCNIYFLWEIVFFTKSMYIITWGVLKVKSN